MIAFIVIISILALLIGYIFYGRFLSNQFKLDNSCVTPACKINDGVDYVPAKSGLLLGQHFSAIAAAGPIVGPILAFSTFVYDTLDVCTRLARYIFQEIFGLKDRIGS
ncbi:MAG: carbon starvation CstA family protein [Candidatus Firestonebacteria bacterium]